MYHGNANERQVGKLHMAKKEEVFRTALHPDDVEMIRSDLGALGDIICCREFSILDVSTLRIVFSKSKCHEECPSLKRLWVSCRGTSCHVTYASWMNIGSIDEP